MHDPNIATITNYLSGMPSIEVAWLYGSRASGKNGPASDYDIAVALTDDTSHRMEVVEELRFTLAEHINAEVSVADINRLAAPLAYNVVDKGEVLVCKSDLRLRAEQQRVWSLWELYKFEHEHNRKTV